MLFLADRVQVLVIIIIVITVGVKYLRLLLSC